MSCAFFLLSVENGVLEFLPSEERNSLDLSALEVEIFEIRGKNLSALVPFWNNVQIFSIFSIKVIIGLNITSLLLSVPSKES